MVKNEYPNPPDSSETGGSQKPSRNKVNRRHNSPSGKSKGARVWLKNRHRVKRRLLR